MLFLIIFKLPVSGKKYTCKIGYKFEKGKKIDLLIFLYK